MEGFAAAAPATPSIFADVEERVPKVLKSESMETMMERMLSKQMEMPMNMQQHFMKDMMTTMMTIMKSQSTQGSAPVTAASGSDAAVRPCVDLDNTNELLESA